jgi:D-beta-D-heptose 7-phosphate kinase/D-beta-D-heptose 1-phosphate adenosyltransferase
MVVKMKIVVVSGGFDPVHSGHIDYLYAAKQLGDMLVVGVNSDTWLERKKGRSFMPVNERFSIINSLKPVDHTMVFNDDDGSAIDLLKQVKRVHPDDEIIFANGGDRTAVNIPEMTVTDVVFKFGVGGEHKANSSSWILQEWKAPKTERPWGYYRVLHEVPGMKVKELTVNPGCSLSVQRHEHRNEFWIVSEGKGAVNWDPGQTKLKLHSTETITKREWHQLTNPYDYPFKVVEIQYGSLCDEADIERKP